IIIKQVLNKKSMNKKTLELIHQISADLRLSVFCKDAELVISRAVKEKTPYEEMLLELLLSEQETRSVNRKKAQLRNAGFPQQKYLQDLIRSELPPAAIAQLPILETLDFIDAGQHVILAGLAGIGKTYIYI